MFCLGINHSSPTEANMWKLFTFFFWLSLQVAQPSLQSEGVNFLLM